MCETCRPVIEENYRWWVSTSIHLAGFCRKLIHSLPGWRMFLLFIHSGMILEVQSPFLLQLVLVVPLISNPFLHVKVHLEPILYFSFQNVDLLLARLHFFSQFGALVELSSYFAPGSRFKHRERQSLHNSEVVLASIEELLFKLIISWPQVCTQDYILSPAFSKMRSLKIGNWKHSCVPSLLCLYNFGIHSSAWVKNHSGFSSALFWRRHLFCQTLEYLSISR